MAKIFCSRCGKELMGDYPICPYCRTPRATQGEWGAKKKPASGGVGKVRVIGIILIILGIIGFLMGTIMFGDIGIACMVGALSALLSGIGFLVAAKKIKELSE